MTTLAKARLTVAALAAAALGGCATSLSAEDRALLESAKADAQAAATRAETAAEKAEAAASKSEQAYNRGLKKP
jgi:hypothetical protein